MKKEYTLGVIGGMGPMATALFMQMIIEHTDASCDQEHLPMIVRHLPYIPDRTSFILGNSNHSPAPYIKEAALKLQKEGVAQIAVPCVTSHFFHDEIQKDVSIPVLDGLEDAAEVLEEKGYKKVGVMATNGTVSSGLFTKALSDKNIDCIYPDETHQQYVMDVIYDCVKSNRIADKDKVQKVLSYLQYTGAEVVVLGCTELSLIPKEYLIGETLDVMETLAIRCIKDWKNETACS
jgi:aspartate racemase